MPSIGETRFEDDSIWTGFRWASSFERIDNSSAISAEMRQAAMSSGSNPFANRALSGAGAQVAIGQSGLGSLMQAAQQARYDDLVGGTAKVAARYKDPEPEPEPDPVLLLLETKA